jgi:hypothetical protein
MKIVSRFPLLFEPKQNPPALQNRGKYVRDVKFDDPDHYDHEKRILCMKQQN